MRRLLSVPDDYPRNNYGFFLLGMVAPFLVWLIAGQPSSWGDWFTYAILVWYACLCLTHHWVSWKWSELIGLVRVRREAKQVGDKPGDL